MKINCLIVDDEPASRNVLKNYMADTAILHLLGECRNAIEAGEYVKDQQIDLLFLDINMPKITGIQFLKSLAFPPKVIFTTAYPEYAVEGFNLDVVDYLLKPFSFERFLKGVNKYLYLTGKDKQSLTDSRTLFLKSEKKIYRILTTDIDYIEAIGDYVKVIFGDQSIVVHSTFQDLMEQIDHPDFIRIHRSFAVAIHKFKCIDGNQLIINNKSLPIGKAYRKELMARIELK